jgi:hypothetical protein
MSEAKVEEDPLAMKVCTCPDGKKLGRSLKLIRVGVSMYEQTIIMKGSSLLVKIHRKCRQQILRSKFKNS